MVESVLTTPQLDDLRSDLRPILANASSVTESDDIYDLEPGHAPDSPRVRRIKTPHLVMPSVDALARSPVLAKMLLIQQQQLYTIMIKVDHSMAQHLVALLISMIVCLSVTCGNR